MQSVVAVFSNHLDQLRKNFVRQQPLADALAQLVPTKVIVDVVALVKRLEVRLQRWDHLCAGLRSVVARRRWCGVNSGTILDGRSGHVENRLLRRVIFFFGRGAELFGGRWNSAVCLATRVHLVGRACDFLLGHHLEELLVARDVPPENDDDLLAVHLGLDVGKVVEHQLHPVDGLDSEAIIGLGAV